MEAPNPYASPNALEAMGPLPLPPPSVAGALAAGTTLYLQRFPAVAAITVLVWGPIELFINYRAYYLVEEDAASGGFALSTITEALFGIIVVAALTTLGAAQLRGQRLSWWQALGNGLDAWPRMFGSRLIGGIVILIGLVFLIVPGLYLAVRFSLTDSAASLERQNGMNALRRSMELTEGAFFRFLGLAAAVIGALLAVQFGILVGLELSWMVELPLAVNFAISTLGSLLIDLAAGWGALVYVAAYVACQEAEMRKKAIAASSPGTDSLATA